MDLNALILGMRGRLQAIMPRNVELKIDLEPSLGGLLADGSAIEQVLIHLAENAREAMPDGGTLTIETVTIRRQHETSSASTTYILLRVTDTGSGTPAAKDGVFEPLYENAWDTPGAGLGLAAVYGIVKQAGGWISIFSGQGVGSSIEIFLPCDDSKAA